MPHVNQWSIHISANSKVHSHHGVETPQNFMGSTFVESFEFPPSLCFYCSRRFFRAHSARVVKGDMFKMHGSVAVESVELPPSFETEWYATKHPCHVEFLDWLLCWIHHVLSGKKIGQLSQSPF